MYIRKIAGVPNQRKGRYDTDSAVEASNHTFERSIRNKNFQGITYIKGTDPFLPDHKTVFRRKEKTGYTLCIYDRSRYIH